MDSHGQRGKRTNKTELDKLLGDEGTVKLLLNNPIVMTHADGTSTVLDSSSIKSVEELKKNVLRRANKEDTNDEGGRVGSLRGTARKGSAEHDGAASNGKDTAPPANKRRRSSLIGSLKSEEGTNHKSGSSQGSSSKEANNHLPAIITSKIINSTILHIIFSFPSPTNCKLTTEMLTNLCKVIDNANSDSAASIHSILLTSTGAGFCNGLEYEGLLAEKPETRRKKATAMLNALKSLIQSLKNSKKRMIAGVQSDVSNFGILLLNLFDFVYVSDKANFSTDYYLYNTIPELLYPDWCRDMAVTSMLTTRRHLTAEQLNSTSIGLVTEVLWPSKFNEELVKRLIMISSCNSKISEKTRQLISTTRDNSVFPEQDLLSAWTSDGFQVQVAKIRDKRDK